MLISLNGQVLGDIGQYVKKYGGLAALGTLTGLVSSDSTKWSDGPTEPGVTSPLSCVGAVGVSEWLDHHSTLVLH